MIKSTEYMSIAQQEALLGSALVDRIRDIDEKSDDCKRFDEYIAVVSKQFNQLLGM